MKLFITASLLVVLIGTSCQHDSATAQPGGGTYATAASLTIEAADFVDESAREAARLAYAEEVLRRKSTRQLPSHLRRRRYQALKVLHKYRTTGQVVVPAAAPGLLDPEGRPAALGYLMQQTGRPDLPAQLDRQYHAPLSAIDDAALRHWVRMSGLTMEECAMIQGAR
ncbi:hypothetical protein [Hymenobacter jeollabukensis]|uniref:Uncharacterized protein n=1 Tax=Hymenobacter jeollabukensis TaxID=2025313 RepID=A0A5R8WR50_9BACT|nr:hypothetical protein [Hymenobacter jeollabukensis]TLM93227.1 hypothetical protein FDY95_11430 [Hymenobacter jeollabukensis]